MKELLRDNTKRAFVNCLIGMATLMLTLFTLWEGRKEIEFRGVASWTITALGAACLVFSAIWLCQTVAVYLHSRDLVERWENSSGLRHWAELPKGKRILVVARADPSKTTVLGINAIYFKMGGMDSPSWFVQFDVPLPPEIQVDSQIIILDSEEDLLHKDAGKAHPLLTASLTPSRKGDDNRHPLPGAAPAFHQVGEC